MIPCVRALVCRGDVVLHGIVVNFQRKGDVRATHVRAVKPFDAFDVAHGEHVEIRLLRLEPRGYGPVLVPCQMVVRGSAVEINHAGVGGRIVHVVESLENLVLTKRQTFVHVWVRYPSGMITIGQIGCGRIR